VEQHVHENHSDRIGTISREDILEGARALVGRQERRAD